MLQSTGLLPLCVAAQYLDRRPPSDHAIAICLEITYAKRTEVGFNGSIPPRQFVSIYYHHPSHALNQNRLNLHTPSLPEEL